MNEHFCLQSGHEERPWPACLLSQGLIDRTAFKFTEVWSKRTVTAGLGRCVAGDRSVPSFTQCRGSLHRDSHTFYIGYPNELLNPQFWKITVKTVDTNHEEAVKSGGESPAGLGLTLGFSAQRGILTRLLFTNLVSSSIVRRW